MTQSGQTCKDVGLSLIRDKNECKIAIESFGRYYIKEENFGFRPKGCYLAWTSISNGYRIGYFNKNNRDRGHKRAKAICKGNQIH